MPKDLRWIEVDYPHLIQLKEEKLANDLPKCKLERVKLDLSDLPARKEFFNQLGWKSREICYLGEESLRLGRIPPTSWIFKILRLFMSKEKQHSSLKFTAYVLLERK